MATAKTKTKGTRRKRTTKPTIHIGLLLDETGSMEPYHQAVVDGTNEFMGTLTGEKNSERSKISLVMFDSHPSEPVCRVKFAGLPLKEYTPIGMQDYCPRGMTPLNDAVAQTIERLGSEMAKGDKAMLVIYTDGHENYSRDYPGAEGAARVKELVEAKEKEGWTFIFLGAGLDAFAVGAGLGLATPGQTSSTTATASGTRRSMGVAAAASASYMSEGGTMTADAAIPDSIGEEEDEDAPVS